MNNIQHPISSAFIQDKIVYQFDDNKDNEFYPVEEKEFASSQKPTYNDEQFENIDCEHMFKTQKVRSKNVKNLLQAKPKQTTKPKKIFNGVLPSISLEEYYHWEASSFTCNIIQSTQELIPVVNENPDKWTTSEQLENIYLNKKKYIELTNIALRTINEIDYSNKGLDITLQVTLQGESRLWIFTRCFVNKDVNESEVFDNISEYNNHEDIFNKYSSFIVLSKEKQNSKAFVEFGSFYEKNSQTENKGILRNSFLKRQLLSDQDTQLNVLETDTCQFQIKIFDVGLETIKVQVALNQSNKLNEAKSDIYIPLNKRSKIMFAGYGESVKVYRLNLNVFKKENMKEFEFSNTKEVCSCCNLF